MAFKIFAGLVAMTSLLVFVGPVVLKLKEASLTIVVLIGVIMMATDIWQSLKRKDD